MRRLLQMVVGVVVMGGTVGCCMHGVCDCEPHGCGTVPGFAACGGCAYGLGPQGVAAATPAAANTSVAATPVAPRQMPAAFIP